MLSTEATTEKDDINHECGVVGIVFKEPLAGQQNNIYTRLFELLIDNENRGQHSTGISIITKEEGISTYKRCGTVNEVFSDEVSARLYESSMKLKLVAGIGHVRWATAGEGNPQEAQPWHEKLNHHGDEFSVAFNGHIANYIDLRKEMEEKINPVTNEPFRFTTKVDTELLSHLILEAHNQGFDMPGTILHLEQSIVGAFNILFISSTGEVFAYRDKHGFHPLCYSESDDCFEFSSESAALDKGTLSYLKPGEAFVIDKEGSTPRKIQILPAQPKICSLEFMYFANKDSEIDGVSIRTMREFLGQQLSELEEVDENATVKVVPVPASAVVAAESFAMHTGIQVKRALVKKPKSKRSYTAASEEIERIIVEKFIYLSEDLPEEIILVDDTLIKGATLRRVISEFRKRGVKKVHIRIAAPPITNGCPFGVFIETKKLVMNSFSEPKFDERDKALCQQIALAIGADSLRFITSNNVYMAHKLSGGDTMLCMGCMTGDYINKAQKYL